MKTSTSATELFDAAIVGAGPAGACTAFELARAGASVVLLEKAALPRYKTCGGGVVRRALRLLPFEVQDAIEVDCRHADLTFMESGFCFRVARRDPIISMTMRSRFDFLLVSKAAEAGASVWPACDVLDLDGQGDAVCLRTSRGTVRARQIVLASGGADTLARRAGWKEDLQRIPALEWEVHVDSRTFERFRGVPRFDFDVVPRGYAWVFPKRSHLSAGILSRGRSAVSLNHALEDYLRRIGLNGIRRIDRYGFIIASRPRKGAVARGRILLAGDAAGLVDPLTCEGITNAARSGQLAARALLESEFDPAATARAYSGKIRREILPELRVARLLSHVLDRMPRVRRWLFSRYGQAFCEVLTDVFTGERSYRELVREPRNYVKLVSDCVRGFDGPGRAALW